MEQVREVKPIFAAFTGVSIDLWFPPYFNPKIPFKINGVFLGLFVVPF
jgi:hypothetical protein